MPSAARSRRTGLVLAVLATGALGVPVASSVVSSVAEAAIPTSTTTTSKASSTTSTSRATSTTAKSTTTTKRPATTTTAAPTTTTTAPPLAPAPPVDAPPAAPPADDLEHVPPVPAIDAGPKGLTTGASGDLVKRLEERLAQLRFSPGPVDGKYDARTFQAVMAFQKQQELGRTGKANPETLAKVVVADLGVPMTPKGEATRVEVDLKRQIAQFWKDRKLLKVIPISSGNGAHYCVPKDKGGGCDVAITPGGSYRADRKIKGDRESKLGHLYDPVYVNGGIAIHGSPSVPAGPASHGCMRVPMWESRWVYDNVQIGDPVYILGGKVAPVPFSEAAPTTGDDLVAPGVPG